MKIYTEFLCPDFNKARENRERVADDRGGDFHRRQARLSNPNNWLPQIDSKGEIFLLPPADLKFYTRTHSQPTLNKEER